MRSSQKVPLLVSLPKGVHKRLVQYAKRNGMSLNAAVIDVVMAGTASQTVAERAAALLAEALVCEAREKEARQPESLTETVRKLQHNQVVLERMVANIMQPAARHDQPH